MLKPVKLDYDFSIFLTAEYESSEGSCIKHLTHELTDVYKKFDGFPPSYCYENTRINQLWWSSDQIDFQQIGQQLGMEVVTVSSIRQLPGSVIPWNRDTFYQIKQRFPERTSPKVRANIYLEDWKLGHIIQFNDTVDVNWTQGNGWLWDSEVLHLGANAGMQNKFTLQVSGFLNK
jgi:hypothetical protein